MKVLFTTITVLILLTLSNLANALDCRGLAKYAPKGVQLSAQRHAPDAGTLRPFCLVLGRMDDRIGMDGRAYSLKFELRLPDRWRGRFAYQFNEGNDGIVEPALGNIAGQTSKQFAINNGFAVISSNGGHDALPLSRAGLMGASLFGYDPQARKDYGYDAVRKLYPVARALIQQYYAAPIRYSYGLGSSNGGRMAMVAASRYPQMFDGLVVGYPALNFPKAALQFAWNVQTLYRVNHDIGAALTERDIDLISKALIDQCDTLDGLKDDLIFASDTCQKRFQPTLLACKSEFDRYCLAPQKIAAIMRMQQGPKNSKGQSLYSGWIYDLGMNSKNWREWRLQSTVSAWQFRSIGTVLGAASLANIFITPPANVAATPNGLESYLLHFNFDHDAPKIYATNPLYQESSLSFMNPPDINSPTLEAFKRSGGKMIIFHGNSDPVFSVKNTIRWYNYLDFNQAGKAHEFVRLYRIPGMTHGQGGPAPDQFDMLTPLVHWVERKQAPQAILASVRDDNPEATVLMSGVQRPLCPYPTTAFYHGGDSYLASSFACETEAP